MLGLHPTDAVRAAEESLMRHVPEESVMQRAAFGLAVECTRVLRSVVGQVSGTRVLLLIGSGNNGGDALFAGAELQRRGAQVTALTVGDRWHRIGAAALVAAGGRLISTEAAGEDVFGGVDVIVDGLVGIGASGALRDPMVSVVRRANRSDAIRVAVDIASGVDVNDGSVPESSDDVFHADVTVTFGCPKPAHYLFPARRFSGALTVVDIGLTDHLHEPEWKVLEPDDVQVLVPAPAWDSYKYRRGLVGIAAGSERYPGAAMLVTGGARYTGTGMTMFLDRRDGVADAVISRFPEVVRTATDPRDSSKVTGWVAGPGFVGDEQDAGLLGGLLEVAAPVVLDAGALRLLAENRALRRQLELRQERGLVSVLTPHAGEYANLGGDAHDVRGLARELGAIIVRKGPGTTIAAPDGTAFVDPMGTPALASAGSGDVLAGIIGGLLATHHSTDSPIDIASATSVVAAAVWLHGLAGRLASSGDRPVVATDVEEQVQHAIAALRRGDV